MMIRGSATLDRSAALFGGAYPSARVVLFRKLAAAVRGDVNDEFIAGMVATWATGGGVLPRWMGLPPALFREMLTLHFGRTAGEIGAGRAAAPDPLEELQDLRDLLLRHRSGRTRSERWVVELICAGCSGHDHLWSDLGLMSRPELTRLMRLNFPRLAARNTGNMRWKRFLYKLLCEGEGVYICRAPSCDMCSEKPVCFAPDDE